MKKLARLYCLATGACDVITGLLLVLMPAWTMGLMRVHDALTEPIWMRFIGAFVFGVGLLYLHGLKREPRGGVGLTEMMRATMVVRACIAVFTGWAIVSGALSPAWISVCISDAAFATIQALLIRKDAFQRET